MVFTSQRMLRGVLCLAAGFVFLAARAEAKDAFYEVPYNEIEFKEGKRPAELQNRWRIDWQWSRWNPRVAYVTLDGDGEVYLGTDLGVPRTARNANGSNPRALAIRASSGKSITGSLYLPTKDGEGMDRYRFTVSPSKATARAQRNFYLTKEQYYRNLSNRRIPGNAWFRHQQQVAHEAWAGTAGSSTQPRNTTRPRRGMNNLEDTFALLSGGRALSENLQLDRLLRATQPGESTVDISTLKGITVEEMDWTELTKGADPETDPLASYVPADQHVLFFRSFRAMTTLMDEAAVNGTPLLHMIMQRSENARTRERFEKQLCLSVSAISRLFGPAVINSVAMTGSDPYLRIGTDIAFLFEAKSTDALRAFLKARHAEAALTEADCQLVSGRVGNVSYTGAITPNRAVCSYAATLGKVVVVTNSLAQLERLAETARDRSKSIAGLQEYRFFRQRYKRTDADETALLLLSDAAIRRWCSPKWRIATSRRTRAAAIMAELQAQHMPQLVVGTVRKQQLHSKLYVADVGTLFLTKNGVVSSTYGSLDFLTPIIELDFDKVTKQEARAYEAWRNGYQRNWTQAFDPVAIRFSIRDDRLAADLTVMPLIASSEYNQFIRVTEGAEIKPGAGDLHKQSLLHFTMAVNPQSETVRQAGTFLQVMMQGIKGSPFGWLGGSVSFYADDDPFWKELAESKESDRSTFLLREVHRLPVAFQAEVSNSLKLTLFLVGVRALIEQTAPGLTKWETLKHNEQPYVKITPTDQSPIRELEKLAVYYAATPESLVVTLSEDLMKRSLDRIAARRKAVAEKKELPREGKPWIGKSLGFQVDRKALELYQPIFGRDYRRLMQQRCWTNLPILNEWKRLYPKRDPIDVHETYWQVRLLCPGGGSYIWNEEFQTMESTVFGHPGKPKNAPRTPLPLANAKSLNFGIDFEHKGLRARVVIERTKP